MEIRLQYEAPMSELILMKTEGLLEGLSMGISDKPAPGGGDAKKFDFFDDAAQEYQPKSLWDE